MRKVRTAEEAFAYVHGILLMDEGSCEVPADHTLTLQEWQAQQAA